MGLSVSVCLHMGVLITLLHRGPVGPPGGTLGVLRPDSASHSGSGQEPLLGSDMLVTCGRSSLRRGPGSAVWRDLQRVTSHCVSLGA